MLPASHPARGRALLVGGLLLAGLFGLLQLAPAQNAKDKTKDEAKDDKAAAKVPAAPKALAPLRLVLDTREGKITPDVAEMKKLIDDKIAAGWEANKVGPTAYCDDYTFIRRASLDIVGRIAKPEEIERYFKNPSDKRRSMLVNDLLAHEDYARHWANLWSNWLLTRSGDFGRGKYHEQMQVWLEDQFAQNKKYPEMAKSLLTASGSNKDNGAVNFILAHLGESVPGDKRQEEGQWEMVPLTSRLTRVFLGTQTQCAQCHPHPFAQSLKQEMFWGVNAFLRQVVRNPGPMGPNQQRMMVRPDLTLSDNESANPDANVFFELRSGKVKMWKAEFMPSGGKERGPRLDPKKTGVARREALAEYLVDHDMFGKAMVNRMWGLFLGRGFVNPVDDFNDNNQPSNPELLTEMAAQFKHYGYDFKKLIRWIAHSQAYQLSHVANASNDKAEQETLHARMVMKALSPEQMFESIAIATKGGKALAAADRKTMRDRWLGQLIDNFGDDEGNESNFNGTIVQALMMMNGRDINEAISRVDGTVAQLASPKSSDTTIITRLYLAALNRPPTAAELRGIRTKMQLVDPKVAVKDSAKARYEDLFWALLNSNEFLLNH